MHGIFITWASVSDLRYNYMTEITCILELVPLPRAKNPLAGYDTRRLGYRIPLFPESPSANMRISREDDTKFVVAVALASIAAVKPVMAHLSTGSKTLFSASNGSPMLRF